MSAFGETAELTAQLNLTGNFVRNLSGARKALGSFDKQITNTQGRAYKAGQQIGVGIKRGALLAASGISALASQVAFGLNQIAKLEKVEIQTNAVLTSTKHAAGLSGKAIRAMAEEYENLNATMDDKVIQSAENVLLTFTAVNKKAFKPALEAALNINEALGGGESGLQRTVVQLGKALQDPVKGITALRRVGVNFSEQQVKRIGSLVKENKLYEAQQIILKELSKEFGGSFRKAGQSTEATIAGIGDAVEDLQKGLATALFPTIKKVLPRIREFLTDPGTIAAIEGLGDDIADLFSEENIKAGTDAIKGAFELAKQAAPVVAAAAKTAVGVLKTAADIFAKLPPEIQALAVSGIAINKLTGGLVTNIAGGLIGAVLKQLVSGVVNVNGAVVNVNGAAGLPGAVGGAGGGGVTGLIGNIVKLAVPVAVAAFIAGNFLEANQDPNRRGIYGTQGQRGPRTPPKPKDWGSPISQFKRGTPQNTENPDRTEERIARHAAATTREVKRLVGIAKGDGPRAQKALIKLDRIRAEQGRTTNGIQGAKARISAVKGAIDRKKLNVKVTVPIKNVTTINGRLVSVNLKRYQTITHGGIIFTGIPNP